MTESQTSHPPNRLIHETSPYLLQHAHNPVDWYPWGEEALEQAKEKNKPILLSVGYSACHWCHVMERESFENQAIADLMNRYFINIKVDREERPDIDEIYMQATTAMNQGHGGWPMTVFLTPNQEPIFAGTYFPPTDKWGRPGFGTILVNIGESWQRDQSKIVQQASQFTDRLRSALQPTSPLAVGEPDIEAAVQQFARDFDARYGGFGRAPKFPPATGLSFLLRQYHWCKQDKILNMVTKTLDGMAAGGMYDHIGGGFARYSTDDEWLVPHFEKMLYDNALMARTYIEAFQVTGNDQYRRVATETLDYILREMTSPEGGFYSATDADSGRLVLAPHNAQGIVAIGVLVGLALLISAYYQGRCLASAINATKSKPEIFGLSIAPAAIIEGFAVFAFVFALVLSGALPEVSAPATTTAAARIGQFLIEMMTV